MSSSPGGWTDVEASVDRIIGDATHVFDASTIENARELLGLLKGRYPVPEIGKGYRNTIRLIWQTTVAGPLEIEVFDDRLEVYHFEPAFGVWYEPHRAGEPFTPKFMAALPTPIIAD
jgi:hypothetical protein